MFGFGEKRRRDEPEDSAIVPRIKHRNFLNAVREQGVPPEQMPVTEPLVADLLIAYAFDLPGMFRMVSPVDLEKLGIDRAGLRPLAVANLKRQLPGIGVAEEPPLKRIVTGNDLEACTLLADSFWDEAAAEMPGGIAVAVPHRSVVLFGPAGSEDVRRAMGAVAAEAHRADPVHSLSVRLITRSGGAWAVLAG